ncbi:MAG: N-acetyltransferase [Lachnospiraceae bacterium]|nr:N-acetyltransferase [Lachnospiraceae bacterium]
MDRAGLYAGELTINVAEEIYEKHLKGDFPPDEVKPFSIIKEMWLKKNYYMYGFYEKGKGQREETLCAYAFLLADHKRKMLLLDYFAVCGQLRGSGYGSCALAMLREECADWSGIMIEVEDDELPGLDEETRKVRQRRIAFYKGADCQMTTTRSRLWGVDYRIMVLPVMDSQAGEDMAGKIRSVYQCMYDDAVLQKRFAITAK